jgi:nucleoside transporter
LIDAMQTQLKVKLSFFNFLQYFVWGSWYASMGAYLTQPPLNFDGQEVGLAYGAFAIGSMISPFLVGLLADRYFASEKLLAVFSLVGGAVLCVLPSLKTFMPFYSTLILYCALFTPTLALGNSLALTHLQDAKTAFPRVKLWSAVGWIGGGVTLSLMKGELSPIQFYLAGGVSIGLALFSLTLPHTPPKKTGENIKIGELLGLDALSLMKKPSFAIFIGCMFLICIPLYFYFVMLIIYLKELGWTYLTAKMSLAQVSDIVFMFCLPIMLKKFGYKKTIFLGILAWAARYFCLGGSVDATTLAAPLIFAAILMHGVCYDFLFIAGQLYVDDEANPKIRAACQGFIAFILWGVGAFVGTMLAGKVLKMYANSDGSHDWASIWPVPAYLSVGVLIIFALFFKEPTAKPAEDAEKPT